MTEKCSYCDNDFDDDVDGHCDENTGLFFCWAVCESNYDKDIGLPSNYIKAFGEPSEVSK